MADVQYNCSVNCPEFDTKVQQYRIAAYPVRRHIHGRQADCVTLSFMLGDNKAISLYMRMDEAYLEGLGVLEISLESYDRFESAIQSTDIEALGSANVLHETQASDSELADGHTARECLDVLLRNSLHDFRFISVNGEMEGARFWVLTAMLTLIREGFLTSDAAFVPHSLMEFVRHKWRADQPPQRFGPLPGIVRSFVRPVHPTTRAHVIRILCVANSDSLSYLGAAVGFEAGWLDSDGPGTRISIPASNMFASSNHLMPDPDWSVAAELLQRPQDWSFFRDCLEEQHKLAAQCLGAAADLRDDADSQYILLLAAVMSMKGPADQHS